MYAASPEQQAADRAAAFAAGVPAGYRAPGAAYEGQETIELWVESALHSPGEYGAEVDAATGAHTGGAFTVRVPLGMRVEDLRLVIRDVGGIPPALQRLSYAGRGLDDAQRTLAHYGVGFWHRKFPHWPIRVRRY